MMMMISWGVFWNVERVRRCRRKKGKKGKVMEERTRKGNVCFIN